MHKHLPTPEDAILSLGHTYILNDNVQMENCLHVEIFYVFSSVTHLCPCCFYFIIMYSVTQSVIADNISLVCFCSYVAKSFRVLYSDRNYNGIENLLLFYFMFFAERQFQKMQNIC